MTCKLLLPLLVVTSYFASPAAAGNPLAAAEAVTDQDLIEIKGLGYFPFQEVELTAHPTDGRSQQPAGAATFRATCRYSVASNQGLILETSFGGDDPLVLRAACADRREFVQITNLFLRCQARRILSRQRPGATRDKILRELMAPDGLLPAQGKCDERKLIAKNVALIGGHKSEVRAFERALDRFPRTTSQIRDRAAQVFELQSRLDLASARRKNAVENLRNLKRPSPRAAICSRWIKVGSLKSKVPVDCGNTRSDEWEKEQAYLAKRATLELEKKQADKDFEDLKQTLKRLEEEDNDGWGNGKGAKLSSADLREIASLQVASRVLKEPLEPIGDTKLICEDCNAPKFFEIKGETCGSGVGALRFSLSEGVSADDVDWFAVTDYKLGCVTQLKPNSPGVTIAKQFVLRPNYFCPLPKRHTALSEGCFRAVKGASVIGAERYAVRIPKLPPTRTRVLFDSLDGRHHSVEWEPFSKERLYREVELESGTCWAVSLWGEPDTRESFPGFDGAWSFRPQEDDVKFTERGGQLKVWEAIETESGRTSRPFIVEVTSSDRPRDSCGELVRSLAQPGGGDNGGPDVRDRSAVLPVVEPIAAEALSIAAEIAVERARSAAGKVFSRRLRDITCEIAPKTSDGRSIFKNTCETLANADFGNIVGTGQSLSRALFRDAMAVALLALVRDFLVLKDPPKEWFDPLELRTEGTGVGGNEFNTIYQTLVEGREYEWPSGNCPLCRVGSLRLPTDIALAIDGVDEILSNAITSRPVAREFWQTRLIELTQAYASSEGTMKNSAQQSAQRLFAAVAYCHRQGNCDARTVVGLLKRGEQANWGVQGRVRTSRLINEPAFVERALEILQPDAASTATRQALLMLQIYGDIFTLHIEATTAMDVPSDTGYAVRGFRLERLALLRELAEAIVKMELEAALSATGRLVVSMVAHVTRNTPDAERVRPAAQKTVAVLTALSSYISTYRSEEKLTDSERKARHEARKAALNQLIDATTDRSARQTNIISSAGILVGGAAGVDIQTGSGAWNGLGGASARLPVPALPLGLTVQVPFIAPYEFGDAHWSTKNQTFLKALVGFEVDALHKLVCNDNSEYWCPGVFLSVYPVDVAQYANYSTFGITQPRLDTALAFGFAGGIFTSQEWPFVLGADFRYSPTLFSQENVLVWPAKGGVLRASVFVGYYVSFFDFN